MANLNLIPDSGILMDERVVSPSPNRDFYQIVITREEIIVRRWIISSTRRSSVPMEARMSFEEFRRDYFTQSEVQNVFGQTVVDQAFRLIGGSLDFLPRLPDSVLIKIFSYLCLSDRQRLGRVCKRLFKISMMETVWENAFRNLFGQPMKSKHYDEAFKVGWKNMFFSYRLHEKDVPMPLMRGAVKR